MKIRKKISIVFSLFVAAVSLYVSAVFYERSMKAQTEDLRRNLTELAISASLMLDGDTHAKAYASGDMTSPEYLRIRDILRRFKKEIPRARYVYTMVKGDRPGVYKFAIDASEPLDENGDGKITSDEDITPIGEDYDASNFPEMLSAFDGATADRKLTSDKWGSFLSGYAPIYDSSGKAVAIVGLDVTARTIVAELRALQIRIAAIFLSGVIMALFFSRLISKGLTRPIQKLIDGTKILGGGDFSHKIHIDSKDEIEFLADAMNSMGDNINDKLQKLSTLNKVSETLASSIELDKALKSSLNIVFELTSSPAGLILLTDNSENRVKIAISEGVRPPKIVEDDAFIGHKKFDTRLSEIFREWIKLPANNTAHGIDELKKIPEAAEAVEWLDAAECGYIAPLIFKDTLCGFLLYTNKLEGPGDFLKTLFYQITMAIENARLYYSAITDGLTGLYIHRYFQLQLEQEFQRARRYGRFFSLLMVDIDHFKKINDTFG
ncbi:MAG: diguanylate cyclase, partial [Endomicrobiia bacterium]|nr:diguanylate cyclase [Endomicrobiia bacterium]